MRAIIEIYSPYGGDQEGDWHDITDRLIGGAKIRYAYEGTAWSYGVAKCGIAKLRFDNSDNFLSPSHVPGSLFAHVGTDACRLRVRYGDDVIFFGFISSRISSANFGKETADLTARSIENLLQQISSDRLTLSGTVPRLGVLSAIFSLEEVRELVPTYFTDLSERSDDSTATYEIADLLAGTRNLLEVLNRMLQVEDAVFAYDYAIESFVVTNRGAIPQSRPIVLRSYLDILEVSDGTERVFNDITAVLSNTGTEVNKQNAGSISAYGLRSLRIDAKFLAAAEADDLLEYIEGRLSAPAGKVEILLDADYPDVDDSRWSLGERVNLGGLQIPKPRGAVTYATNNPVDPRSLVLSLFDSRVIVDGRGIAFKRNFTAPSFPEFELT